MSTYERAVEEAVAILRESGSLAQARDHLHNELVERGLVEVQAIARDGWQPPADPHAPPTGHGTAAPGLHPPGADPDQRAPLRHVGSFSGLS